MTQTIEEVETEITYISPSTDTPDREPTPDMDLDAPVPCQNYFDNAPCDNEADYLCGVTCCNVTLLFCQDCFFFLWRKNKEMVGQAYKCNHCHKRFPLPKDHLRVISRIR